MDTLLEAKDPWPQGHGSLLRSRRPKVLGHRLDFPDPRHYPDGLLAVGGDLSSARLLRAYRQGIFPWHGPNDPILWWSPDPRGVLYPQDLHISRSLAKQMRDASLRFSMNTAFDAVISACAAPRHAQTETWINPEMITAYQQLHAQGHAHSVEVWQADTLVGGLYGLAFGGLFCGESMFSRIPSASKMAQAALCRQLHAWGFGLIDTQFLTPHLASMGAQEIPRDQYLDMLPTLLASGASIQKSVHPGILTS